MTVIKLRRGESNEWSMQNPLLAEGEPGYEEDSGRLKIGDGVTRWNQLAYFGDTKLPGDFATMQDLLDHIHNPDDPHPEYEDGRSYLIRYQNAKV